MDIAYWRTAWTLRARGDALRGEVASIFGEIDASLHRFEPKPDRTLDQIDEPTLRSELTASIERLRILGALE
jgi:hypothetical protein